MKHLKTIALTVMVAGGLAVFTTGCEELKSEKRMVKRQVQLYQVTMSKGDFKDARRFHSKEFVWLSPKGKYKGTNPTKAFLRSVEKTPERSDVYIDLKDVTKIKQGKYLVKARFRVRGHTSSSVTTVSWNATMTWVRSGDKWHCIEHKELTERKRKRT